MEKRKMGAQENKKLMESIFAGVAAGDRSALVDCLADDVTMRVTGQYSWSRTFKGKAALLRELYGYLQTLLAEGRRTIPLRFIADGDYVVIEAKGDMVTKEGVRYDNDYCLIYRLKAGKIVEITEYLDSTLCERVLGKFPAPRARRPPRAFSASMAAKRGSRFLI
jgi:ketosteroid isomerase-like protein